jgi:hypothetical protein
LLDGGDELLVSLATSVADESPAGVGLLDQVFRVTASEYSLGRVRRRWDEGTVLRAYLSHDGAVIFGGPALGGNAACEPATTPTWQNRKRPISQEQPPPDDR